MRILLTMCAVAALAACDQNQSKVSVAATGAAATAAAKPSAAPLAKNKALALMKARHEKYEEIGDAMKAAGRELKASSPNLAVVRKSADTIAAFAPTVPGLFPAGTGPDVGRTEAKAEIWQKPEDFRAKAADFNRAARAFQAAARGGNLDAIRAAQGGLGKSCKACHDLYREDH